MYALFGLRLSEPLFNKSVDKSVCHCIWYPLTHSNYMIYIYVSVSRIQKHCVCLCVIPQCDSLQLQ